MAGKVELNPCPRCGKRAGELVQRPESRFRWRVICGACAWSTGGVKLEALAVKLWNEAKPVSSGRRGRRGET